MENTIESTKGKYCHDWGLVEATLPAMFAEFSVCSEECANYSKEFNTCIDFAYTTIKTRQMIKESLH